MRVLIACSILTVLVGCSSHDDDHTHPRTTPAECEPIVEACHPLDKGTGDIHECHESAESVWSAAECTSNKARCLALCVAPSDASGDTSTSDSATDTGGSSDGSSDATTDAASGG